MNMKMFRRFSKTAKRIFVLALTFSLVLTGMPVYGFGLYTSNAAESPKSYVLDSSNIRIDNFSENDWSGNALQKEQSILYQIFTLVNGSSGGVPEKKVLLNSSKEPYIQLDGAMKTSGRYIQIDVPNEADSYQIDIRYSSKSSSSDTVLWYMLGSSLSKDSGSLSSSSSDLVSYRTTVSGNSVYCFGGSNGMRVFSISVTPVVEKTVDITVFSGDTDITSITETFSGEEIVVSGSCVLSDSSVLDRLQVKRNENDEMGEGYSISIDSQEKYLLLTHNSSSIAKIPYTISGVQEICLELAYHGEALSTLNGIYSEGSKEFSVSSSVNSFTFYQSVTASDFTISLGSGNTLGKLDDYTVNLFNNYLEIFYQNDFCVIQIPYEIIATYTLTGTITGFPSGFDYTDLQLFFSCDKTGFEPVVELQMNGGAIQYRVQLLANVPYRLSLAGSGIYELASPSEEFSFSEDSTLPITVKEKPLYPVELVLPNEPDLAGLNISYEYRNEEGMLYTFSSLDSITLPDGTYQFSLGERFKELPYEFRYGSTLTVNGKTATHYVKFQPVTSWDFAGVTDNGFQDTVQNKVDHFRGLRIDASAGGKLAFRINNNDTQFNANTKLYVPVTGNCVLTVEASNKDYAHYTINGDTPASTSSTTTIYNYEGGADEIVIEATGTSYLTSISLTYPAKEVEYVKQPQMPSAVVDDSSNITAQPVGQHLYLSQTGGNMSNSTVLDSSVGYYLFPKSTENMVLSLDVQIKSCGSSNTNGVFIGAFDGTYLATLGIRKGTNLRGIYSKKDAELAGAGKVDLSISAGDIVHFTVQKGDNSLIITSEDEKNGLQTAEYKYGANDVLLMKKNGKDTPMSFGLAVAGAEVIVTNMLLTGADGAVLYDQNNCYYPEGELPVIRSISAEAAESREFITVNWESSPRDGDVTFQLEVSQDGIHYDVISDAITANTYDYILEEGASGDFYFRVCGKLGKAGLGGSISEYVSMTEPVSVKAALTKPSVTLSNSGNSILLAWDAITDASSYQIYRYSYDEGNEHASLLAEVTQCSYTDETVLSDMPYYYYVSAHSSDNFSSPSDTVWTVLTKERAGDYAYEEEAATLFITKKSYDTVYKNQIHIEGISEQNGTLYAEVNGIRRGDTLSLETLDTFSFDLNISEGRNEVNLYFEDENGRITRKPFHFVYLTSYDKVVDASYSGVDGELVNGLPVYRTVQAAVDSVPALNKERVVILIKEGSYEERLVISSPYISLIGEDQEMVNIHCDPGFPGGDMTKRCAIYVESTATGFSAENLTFENDYAYTGTGSNESSDALRNDADNTMYVHVKIVGYQDTLCANKGTQYYYKCYITGNVDFIYGNEPRALFEDCDLVFRYSPAKNSGYVCAPKTSEDAAYGLTFHNCRILSEDGCSGNNYLLARPWGANASITWINCYMGSILNKMAPYHDMSGNAYMEARFFEYYTYGPGFAINESRRQISKTKADEMLTPLYLEWNPYEDTVEVGSVYIGSTTTDSTDKYVEHIYEPDYYLPNSGDDTGLGSYQMEGFAAASLVTGGGLLKESSSDYYSVANGEEFLDALMAVKTSGRKSVIELTADIRLGSNEIKNFDSYQKVIKPYSAQPLTHPALLQSGVSIVRIENMGNLTIFSKNASSILHANLDIKGSSNVIIRNIKFDELWEWDEDTAGDYDRNDWDYMTIEGGSDRVWIDHCTFYKVYDGVIDIKNPSPITNVTISWCEFLGGSEGAFFDEMMRELQANSSSYPYYSHLRDDYGMTEEQIYQYAHGQKKTHLFGQSDEASDAVGIQATLANNYYKDTMDRLPRLRYGISHVYNCIMDATALYEAKKSITDPRAAVKIVSNGASSTCGAQVLLENCSIKNIINALNSGNGSSPAGYINAINTLYEIDGTPSVLEPKSNSTADDRVLITDAEAFVNALPYQTYILSQPQDLEHILNQGAGAGKLNLTTVQWEKTVYFDSTQDDDNPPNIEPPIEDDTEPDTEQPTEDSSEPDIEPPTEDSSEPDTEQPTEDSSEPESPTSGDNIPDTEVPSEDTTTPDIEPPTEDDNPDIDDDTEEEPSSNYESDGNGEDMNYEEEIPLFPESPSSSSSSSDSKDSSSHERIPNIYESKPGTWVQTETGWWYQFDDTTYPADGWLMVDGKWYAFEPDGYMKTGWTFDETYQSWFFLGNDGSMKTDWIYDETHGSWFYLNPDGSMRTGWFFDKLYDSWFYLAENGSMKTGWLLDSDGSWYYLSSNGTMASNRYTPDGYWIDENGKWMKP